MANGYFERGEIYWVRMDNGFGGEQGVGRPGLILTQNEVNNKCSTVTIAFMSTKHHPSNPFYLPVDATGQTSYVVLNQIMTYDKSRIGKFMGMLNSEEQKRIDDALEDLFDLGYVDDTALKEKDREIEARDAVIAEKEAEIAALKAQMVADKAAQEDELNSYKVENAMWQRLYDKALGQVVDMKFAADVASRTAKPVVGAAASLIMEPPKPVEEPPKQPVEPEVEEPEVEDARVDINHCTITRLKKLGFSLPMARLIVSNRPFKDVADLKRVPGMKATQFRIMEPKLCCTPIAEPVEKPVIVKDGPDKGYEDTPVEQPEAESVVKGKVNVNTASAQEIHNRTGLSLSVCFSITGTRKRGGLFKTLDDVRKVDRFPQKKWDAFKELIEV